MGLRRELLVWLLWNPSVLFFLSSLNYLDVSSNAYEYVRVRSGLFYMQGNNSSRYYSHSIFSLEAATDLE